jgi:SMC interacting uncharacterized protein involved in chromosome segregation
MDAVSSEFVRAISALNTRVSTQMGLIQKLQRTSNYDVQIADLQQQIDELKLVVHKLCVQDIEETPDG